MCCTATYLHIRIFKLKIQDKSVYLFLPWSMNKCSDVPGPAWPESPGLGQALKGSGLYKLQAGPSNRA